MADPTDRDRLYEAGLRRAADFAAHNNLPMPPVTRLSPSDRLYHLATCAYYRKHSGIRIMVEKCANRGFGGRAWSWPAYAIDRTPYGVLQHELGHHVDEHFSRVVDGKVERLFSREIYEQSREAPLTGYLGTDSRSITFFMEWFAENFRLYVTNPDLSSRLRPKFHRALDVAGVHPLPSEGWEAVLRGHQATDRIVEQARKKIGAESSLLALMPHEAT